MALCKTKKERKEKREKKGEEEGWKKISHSSRIKY